MTAATQTNGGPKTAQQYQEEAEHVLIRKLNTKSILVRIEGISELIVNAWSEKAKQQLLDSQRGGKRKIREARDPQAEFEGKMYRLSDGGYGFPAPTVKKALVSVAHKDLGVPKNVVQRAVFIEADEGLLVRIETPEPPYMREDMVRVGNGGSDMRFRPAFPKWALNLRMSYDADLINATTLFNLIERAGYGIGIGDWRPERSGEYGRFAVARSQ